MKTIKLIIFQILAILISLFFFSCSEIKTNDPNEVYKYWSGSSDTADLELLKGQYWQSGHWSNEYIVFLKFTPTEEWWIEFIQLNKLQIENEWVEPRSAPDWFTPPNHSLFYRNKNEFDQGSVYFKDSLTNECYIYEIQL